MKNFDTSRITLKINGILTNNIMKFWIIKETPTNFYLPLNTPQTWAKPTDPHTKPPRLFMTEKAAKCALTWWLKGTMFTSSRYGKQTLQPYGQKNRQRNNMQVIPVNLWLS